MFVHKETGDKVYLYTGGLNFAGVPEAVVTFSDKFGLDEADTVLPSHEFFAAYREATPKERGEHEPFHHKAEKEAEKTEAHKNGDKKN